jgi:RNA-directed DNA polymerase
LALITITGPLESAKHSHGACLKSLPAKIALKSTDDEIRTRFRVLNTVRDVATLLEVPPKKLAYYAYKNRVYRTFEIPKRRGGTRVISAPANNLKILQKKINYVLRLVYRPKGVAHGFSVNKSIVSNAASHANRRYVLNVDLKDFFGSINFGRVRGMLMARPYGLGHGAATILAQLCTFNNVLPQGAPSSPIITNMICAKMDSELKKLASTYRCRYTRYVDDITFSTSLRAFPEALARLDVTGGTRKVVAGEELVKDIEESGFAINPEKVRLQAATERQEVTGLVANRFANVPRSYIRQLGGLIHAWQRYGADSAATKFFWNHDQKNRSGGDAELLRRVVRGKIAFVGRVRGTDDPVYRKLLLAFSALNPQYKIKVPDDIDTHFNVIRKALWVLEGPSTQATAFMLEGCGLVTCAHVLGEEGLVVYNSSDPIKRYAITRSHYNNERDVAILEGANIPIIKELRLGDSSKLRLHDPVTLLGFPQHSKGDEGVVYRGEVTSEKRIRFGQPRILISAVIVSGNSGGPVLDSRNRVIGIAATGADKFDNTTATSDYGVIPIETLLEFVAERQPRRKAEEAGN